MGSFFSSNIGRGLAAAVTGGTSEIGRAVSGTARRSGVDPTISAVLGAGANPTPGGGSLGGTEAVSDTAKEAGVKATEQLTEAKRSMEVTQQRMQDDLDARTETAQEAFESRRRAASASRGGGQRRASQYLTTLGGV